VSAAATTASSRLRLRDDDRPGRLLLVVAALLSIAGVSVAAYLTVVHYAHQPIACSSIGDCELVNSSKYADLAGVPVALLGVLSYVAIFLFVAVALIRHFDELILAAWGVAFAGFAFSMYLTYVELRVLDAICVYCVASAAIMTATFVALSAYLWLARKQLLGE